MQGRVAFITGGGSGIARATARRMVEEGAGVVIAEIDPTAAAAVQDELRADGFEALAVPTDVTDLAAIEAAVRAGLDRFGKIDALFNCAGGSRADDAPVTDVDLALWEPTMDLNVRSAVLCSRVVIPHLRAAGGGTVVNMTSLMALAGNSLHLYSAAKGAIISLTRSMAGSYWRDGIRVNAIAPGMVLTERVAARFDPAAATAMGFDDHPFGIGPPVDIANIVLFLSNDESRMITGAVMPADGGLTAY